MTSPCFVCMHVYSCLVDLQCRTFAGSTDQVKEIHVPSSHPTATPHCTGHIKLLSITGAILFRYTMCTGTQWDDLGPIIMFVCSRDTEASRSCSLNWSTYWPAYHHCWALMDLSLCAGVWDSDPWTECQANDCHPLLLPFLSTAVTKPTSGPVPCFLVTNWLQRHGSQQGVCDRGGDDQGNYMYM